MQNEILVLLEQQADNFPELKAFVIAKGLKPSSIFLPQSLKTISEELTYKPNLVLEAMDYLDMVKFYSTVIYNSPDTFIDHVTNLIIDNRTVDNINNSINKSAIDDFILSSKEEAKGFLNNNKILIALYLYTLIVLIFYKIK